MPYEIAGDRGTVAGIPLFLSGRRRHTISKRDWSSDVCSSDLTDIYKAYDQERKENKVVKSKYSDLVERFNENVNDYNELLEENRTLKSRVKDLTNEIGSIYKSAKSFLKERTS